MSNLIFDEAEYLQFLSACIRETPFLQNSASNSPEESRIANLVTQHLQTFIDRGTIRCDRYEYVPNRANLILEYGPETATQTITLAGSHFDVVPANPTLWERNPFELIIEGDKLYGRGTTDCLGHVALVTLLLKQLAIHQIQLNFRLIVVFIADEEYGKDPTIGVLRLNQEGHLEKIKQGC